MRIRLAGRPAVDSAVDSTVPGAAAVSYAAAVSNAVAERLTAAADGRQMQASGKVAGQAADLVTTGATSLSTAWQAVGPMQVNTAAYGLVTGRISSIALDPADTTGNTVYLGTTGGGVWKSTNAAGAAGSVTFAPLTDNPEAFSPNAGSSAVASLSIGAVTVQPGGTGVVLAGTGDPNNSTDSYYGAGILRSTDHGVTWSLVQQSNDPGGQHFSFLGEGIAGFAWSTVSPDLVVVAVSSSAEGDLVKRSQLGYSVRGLYFSADAGATWTLASIQDGSQTVQNYATSFSSYDGNAATSVSWNPVRQRFVAAVRYHGYYESTDGRTWTRMTKQPGAGLTTSACPARPGTGGLTGCPIFRGVITTQTATGDLFALTVSGDNTDQGLYQDLCAGNGSSCANSTPQWGKKLNSTPLDISGKIPEGDYNLALAAVPAATSLNRNDTLLFAGTTEIFRCSGSDTGGCAFRNTTNSTTGCAAPAKVAPAQHAIAFQANVSGSSAPLLFFGNDGGLWRSTDGVNQQGTSCSADDAEHFQNLNGGLGSLAEVSSLSTHPADGGIGLVALGALGSAASTASSANASFQQVWTQMGAGDSSNVAIDQANPSNWIVQSGFGTSLYTCGKGSFCTASDFSGTAQIGSAQVNGDLERIDAPMLLDPALNANVLVGTCRVYRGPTSGGSSWSSSNAISAPLSGSANSACSESTGLIRSIAAGGATVITNAPQTSGSPVLYAGMAGQASGGSISGGHFYRNTQANLANSSTTWQDMTGGTVTNDVSNAGVFNPLHYDVSSIFVDPGDTSGLTVYATVMGFNAPLVYRSTDGASSWVSITANLPNAPANAVVVDPNNSHVVYVAQDTGVYVTSDVTTCTATNSQCWSIYGTALPNSPVTTLVASSAFAVPGSSNTGVLRAGTYGRGIWQIPLLTAGHAAMPVAALSPDSLDFGEEAVGYTSSAQTVTVTNSGNADLMISQISASQQWVETDGCAGTTLTAGASCGISVKFAPASSGAQSGDLRVYGNMSGGYVEAQLRGTGVSAASVALSPSSLSFPDTAVRMTSASQTLTVTNNGSISTTLQAPAVNGDFSVSTDSCGTSLESGHSCTLGIAFLPTSPGPRTGLLTLADSGGTHSISLSGNGLAGEITVSPASLQFPDTAPNQVSVAKSITVSNPGNGPLEIGSVTVSGEFRESDTCASTTLQSGGSCSITVRFVPASTGLRTGSVVIASNAEGDPGSRIPVALSGSGEGAFDVVLTPSALDFGSVFVSTSSAVRNITISNTGFGSGSLGTPSVTGDYVIRANTCGSALPAGTGCTISLAFVPSAAGRRSGSFSMGSDAGTQTATLTGVGTLAATDSLSPPALSFAATVVNTRSAVQTVTLTNQGDVALTLISARIASGDFTAVNGCGPSLPAHTSCSISVVFTPRSVGALTGTLQVDDVQRSQRVSLSGTSLAGPGVSMTPSRLTFAATGVRNTSASQAVMLWNNGDVPLALTSVNLSGDFGLVPGSGSGCAAGATIAPGAGCTMQVAFAPTLAGARSGSLIVTSNAATQTTLLSGTGVDFTLTAVGAVSGTAVNGQNAVFPLLLTPLAPSSEPVTFACTGAPANTRCTVTSTYSDLSATSQVIATVLTGASTSAALRRPGISFPLNFQPGARDKAEPGWKVRVWAALLLPCGLLVCAARGRGSCRLAPLLLLLLAISLATNCGCGSGRRAAAAGDGSGSGGSGGSVSTPPGTYSIVVSATSAGLTRQVSLTLVVKAQ